MSFIISAKTELFKTKRTAAFWITIIGAAFIPLVYLLLFLLDPKETIRDIGPQAGKIFIQRAWQIFCVFVLPMSIILLTTLVTQIEFRNNTWKQVFASPQSLGNIFFSKYLAIHIMILFCFLVFNVLIFSVGIIAALTNPDFAFLEHKIDWQMILKLNLKTYIGILAMSAIQYLLSLRFKNFIASIGIGLLLGIGGIIAFFSQWQHIYKYPYSFAALSMDYTYKPGRPFLENHELNSLCYFTFFIVLAFLDMKMRKAKG
jgi:hypothetical protein